MNPQPTKVCCSGSDAFSLGLLHDIGAALLYRLHPEAYEMVVNRAIAGDVPLVRAEHEAFGTSHDVAAGRARRRGRRERGAG
jgi:hypothetical protein